MRKYEYSNELVNCVKKYLVDDGWHFSFDEKAGVFDFILRIEGKIQKINYIVAVHQDEIVVYGICPINADYTDSNMMKQMAEFCCRANYGLKNGCFELDFSDGEIRYKSFIDCEDTMPSTEVIKNSIHCTALMYETYGSGIIDIIFCDCPAKEAVTKCEKSTKDELRSMITEVIGEDMEDVEDMDIEEIIAHFATRLGNTGESDGDTDTVTDEIKVNPFEGKKEGGVD